MVTVRTRGAVADNDGWYPMHHACADGYLQVAKWLQVQGVLLDAASSDRGRPIEYARDNGHAEVVQWLQAQDVAL